MTYVISKSRMFSLYRHLLYFTASFRYSYDRSHRCSLGGGRGGGPPSLTRKFYATLPPSLELPKMTLGRGDPPPPTTDFFCQKIKIAAFSHSPKNCEKNLKILIIFASIIYCISYIIIKYRLVVISAKQK